MFFADGNNNRIRKISGPSWTLTGTPTCANIGPHPVTIGVTDGIDTVYQSFTITVADSTPPTLTCPGNITTYVTDTLCGAVVQWTPPTGSDDCSTASAISTLQTDSTGIGPNNYFGPGSHYIEYTSTDSSGNANTCSFNITVLDTIAPNIVCPPNSVVQASTASCEAAVSFTMPTANDLCGTATLTQTDNTGLSNGDTFPLGSTTLEYTATDDAGNSAFCPLNIVVVDTLPPTILCEDTILSTEQVVSWALPQVTDNCTGPALTQTAGPSSGATFSWGATTVEYTATDVAGNESTCTMLVIVDSTISVPELVLSHSIKLYPNPSNGLFRLELADPTLVGSQLTVFNMVGQIILQEQTRSISTSIDLSAHAKGVYLVRIDTDETATQLKMLVE